MKPSLFDYFFDSIELIENQQNQSLLVVGAYPFKTAKNFSKITAYQTQKFIANEWSDLIISEQKDFPEGNQYDAACVQVTKSKEESWHFINVALHALKQTGLLVVIGANDANGKRIAKWLQELGMTPETLSKNKYRIVCATKNNVGKINFKPTHEMKLIEFAEDQYFTISGIYGWNKIDVGSDLLTEFLPTDLKGVGADFGCGYGFLSKYILKNYKDIMQLDLIDADYRCLIAAQKNMEAYPGNAQLDYKWMDLTKEQPVKNYYDFIIMNPPFHHGKKADSDIGIRFIETAANSLKNKGCLYMVANAHLPYENALNKNFSTVEKKAEQEGYKIFSAVK